MIDREMPRGTAARGSLRDSPGFPHLWGGSTISVFGDYVTVLAIQVLVVVTLNGGGSIRRQAAAARPCEEP